MTIKHLPPDFFSICAMVKSRVCLGMGDLPPLIGILIKSICKPLRDWADEFITYYIEILAHTDPSWVKIPRGIFSHFS